MAKFKVGDILVCDTIINGNPEEIIVIIEEVVHDNPESGYHGYSEYLVRHLHNNQTELTSVDNLRMLDSKLLKVFEAINNLKANTPSQ